MGPFSVFYINSFKVILCFKIVILVILKVVLGKTQDGAGVVDNPHSDASRLLEAALQEMDGIISGMCFFLILI